MKRFLTLSLAVLMAAALLAPAALADEPIDIIYLTPSTASSFWSQVEVGILQAKADLEKELGITVNGDGTDAD